MNMMRLKPKAEPLPTVDFSGFESLPTPTKVSSTKHDKLVQAARQFFAMKWNVEEKIGKNNKGEFREHYEMCSSGEYDREQLTLDVREAFQALFGWTWNRIFENWRKNWPGGQLGTNWNLIVRRELDNFLGNWLDGQDKKGILASKETNEAVGLQLLRQLIAHWQGLWANVAERDKFLRAFVMSCLNVGYRRTGILSQPEFAQVKKCLVGIRIGKLRGFVTYYTCNPNDQNITN